MYRVTAKHPAAVKCVVAERNQAGVRMFCQVLFEPLLLQRINSAPAHSGRQAVRVQCNHMQVSKIKTVVTLLRRPRRPSPIREISRAASRVVLMIPRRWFGAILEPAPGRPIAVP